MRMIDGEITRVLQRQGVGSYATHWDGAAAIMDIELPPYSIKLNTNHKTMMITGRGVTYPECRPFTEWVEYLASDLQRQGIDPAWWYKHRAALLEIFGLLSSDHREQAPAAKPTDKQADLITADDLDKLRHTLGIDPEDRRTWKGYRNYYCAAPGPCIDSMERLRRAGFVTRGEKKTRQQYYHATAEGCRAAGLNKKQTNNRLEN